METLLVKKIPFFSIVIHFLQVQLLMLCLAFCAFLSWNFHIELRSASDLTSGHHQLRCCHQQPRSMATGHTATAASGHVAAGSDDRELLGLRYRFSDGKLIGSFYNITGWWFGTFFIFPYIGNNHPNWLIFFRGVQTTNQISFQHRWSAKVLCVRESGSIHFSASEIGFYSSCSSRCRFPVRFRG